MLDQGPRLASLLVVRTDNFVRSAFSDRASVNKLLTWQGRDLPARVLAPAYRHKIVR